MYKGGMTGTAIYRSFPKGFVVFRIVTTNVVSEYRNCKAFEKIFLKPGLLSFYWFDV